MDVVPDERCPNANDRGFHVQNETKLMDSRQTPSGSNSPRRERAVMDLVGITGVVLTTLALTYWTPTWISPLRVGMGLISVLFAPGYVTLAAVLSSPTTMTKLTPWKRVESRLGRWEQILLSVVISIAIVPILGIVVSFTPSGVRPVIMVQAISGYTLMTAGVVAIRRLFFAQAATGFLLDDIESWIDRVRDPPTETDLLLNLLIIAVVLVGSVAIVTPLGGQETPQFTELSVLSENESGNLDMNEYLQPSGSDNAATVVMDVTNHEHQSVEYTVVVQVQRAEVRERSVAVLDRTQISTTEIRLDHNESARIPYEITSPDTRTGCRVAFLLYRGSPPESPTVDNAYREVHLWDTADPPPTQASCRVPSLIDADTTQSEPPVSEDS